jgi:hypothetical protein
MAGFDAKRFTEFLSDFEFIIIPGFTDNINLMQYKCTVMTVWHTADCFDDLYQYEYVSHLLPSVGSLSIPLS